MVLLAEFNVIKPDFGLFFWTVIIFVSLWWFLGKKAINPIAKALKEREDSINDALAQADIAREEMNNLKSENEQLLVQAREERAALLRDAKDQASQIISEAKKQSQRRDRKKPCRCQLGNRKSEKTSYCRSEEPSRSLAVQVAETVIKKTIEQ
jgi:F-type H+-transporting ATPase subunit b